MYNSSLAEYYPCSVCSVFPLNVIYFMQQRPSLETSSSTTSQEISCIVWNTKAHYHVHKNLPLVCILSQMNPFHTLPFCFCNAHFNITPPSKCQLHLLIPLLRDSQHSEIQITCLFSIA